jgi:hypothetical protein
MAPNIQLRYFSLLSIHATSGQLGRFDRMSVCVRNLAHSRDLVLARLYKTKTCKKKVPQKLLISFVRKRYMFSNLNKITYSPH